jgi:hypothetical protein
MNQKHSLHLPLQQLQRTGWFLNNMTSDSVNRSDADSLLQVTVVPLSCPLHGGISQLPQCTFPAHVTGFPAIRREALP